MPDLTITSQAAGAGSEGIVVTDDATTYNDGLFTCSRLQAPASLLDETQGAVVMRLLLGQSAADLATANAYLLRWRDDATHRFDFQFVPLSGARVRTSRVGPSGTSNSVDSGALTKAAGDELTVAFAWTATATKVSTDGSAFSSASNDSVPAIAMADFDLLSESGTGKFFNGAALWLATFKGTLTDTIADDLHTRLADGQRPRLRQLKALYPAARPTAVMPMRSTLYQNRVPARRRGGFLDPGVPA